MNDNRSPHLESMLGRYRGIVSDWVAFEAAHLTPEPTGVRIHPGRVAPEVVTDRLRAEGFDISEFRVPGLYQVRSGPRPLSRTIEHWLGLFHIQQTVMALPPLALAPRAGERVLDLCAAPGGKTTHLAELMEGRGPLVAVDRKEKRLRGLLANVYRLGHSNVLVVAADGRTLPQTALFDRILVDAPCSAEGTTRRQRKAPKRGARFAEHVTGLQEELLRTAVRLTRPGGTIVYSTCTYAPEENEAVIDRLIREGQVRLDVIPLDLPHEPGLVEWGGAVFHPDMERAWRVYPHHLDSGGLFMARLRRIEEGGAPAPNGWSPIPERFPGEDPEAGSGQVRDAVRWLEEEMGFPADLLGSLGWMTRGDSIWAHTASEWPFSSWEEAPHRRIVSAGIRALKMGAGGRKTPSNHFLARWGDRLPANRRVDLDREGLGRLLDGPVPWIPGPSGETPAVLTAAGTTATGSVALSLEGMILGRAIAGREGVRHEIPRALAAELREVLESPRA